MKTMRLSKALLLWMLVGLFCVPGWSQEQVDFSGHKVITVQVQTRAQLDTLLALDLDFWSERIGVGPLDIRVSPQQLAQLRQKGFRFVVKIEDVQVLINRERAFPPLRGLDPFDNYLNLSEVNNYLDELANANPQIARVITVGTSLQGRPIRGLALKGGAQIGRTPAVLFEGCQHAREWISVMVPLYIATQLIRDYGVDPTVTRLLNRIEIYIVPVVNPDGYEYTRTNNRLWRKNRRGNYGVDLNRNWDVRWGGPGSSGNQSSDIYRGAAPFSEPESQAIRDFALARPNLVGFIDFHSYSQLVLWPWGYTTAPTPDAALFQSLGTSMRDAIRGVNGLNYNGGPINTTLYAVSGDAVDWMYDRRGVLSFTIELRDTGATGFLLPPSQIRPTCTENYAAALALANAVRTRFSSPGSPGLFEPPLAGVR